MNETTYTALSTGDWIIRFVLIPLAFVAFVTFLWALPSWLKKSKSSVQPGTAWVGAPLWVGAPPVDVNQSAIGNSIPQAAIGAETVRDEAPLLTSNVSSGAEDRGGASAQW